MQTRLHTVVKKRVAFQHVYYIQLDLCFGRDIGDLEVKPLRVALAVNIILQNQIELIVPHSENGE